MACPTSAKIVTETAKSASKLAFAVAAFSVGALLFSGCSTDPNRQKLKYLQGGEKYFKAGRYQEAIIEFRRSVQIDSKFAEAHYQLGRAYLAVRNLELAYRETASAVALDPGNSDVQLQLATLLIAFRQYGQAEAAAKTVLRVKSRERSGSHPVKPGLYLHRKLSERNPASCKRLWNWIRTGSRPTERWAPYISPAAGLPRRKPRTGRARRWLRSPPRRISH